MVSSNNGDLGLLLSTVVEEKVSGRYGPAEDGLLQLPAGPAGLQQLPQLKQGVMAEKRPAKPWGLLLLQQARDDPWLGYKVQAGTLAKACLSPAQRGMRDLKACCARHWESVQGA